MGPPDDQMAFCIGKFLKKGRRAMAHGRYEKWLTDDGLLQIAAWARDGLTNDQIAHNMGIRRTTLFEWSKRFPNIANALKKNKAVADIEVENALHKSAIGYNYDEVYEYNEERPTKDGKEETIHCTKTYHRHMPASVVAQIFWLKNRKPKEWRDKHDVELSGSVDISATLKEAREKAERKAKEIESACTTD
jgi:hypothetical protein